MPITKITTHKADAINRLLQQYKGKVKIEGQLNAFNEQTQEIEDALYDLLSRLSIDDSEGQQLDGIGEIVGQGRLDWADVLYRVFLKGKIGVNVSEGDPERIISVWKILTGASLVHLIETPPGAVDLMSDEELDSSIVTICYQIIQQVVLGGVRVNAIGVFDPDEAFAFAGGSGDNVAGFSSLAAPLEGGKFAYLDADNIPFAFDGDDTDADGFGALGDPFMGGRFQSL